MFAVRGWLRRLIARGLSCDVCSQAMVSSHSVSGIRRNRMWFWVSLAIVPYGGWLRRLIARSWSLDVCNQTMESGHSMPSFRRSRVCFWKALSIAYKLSHIQTKSRYFSCLEWKYITDAAWQPWQSVIFDHFDPKIRGLGIRSSSHDSLQKSHYLDL